MYSGQAACAPVEIVKFVKTSVVVVVPVVIVVVLAVNIVASALQFHPLYAAGSDTVPVLAVPPVPILITKAALPLLDPMKGDVPKPDKIVGAVAEINNFPLIFISVVEFIVVPVIVVPVIVVPEIAPENTAVPVLLYDKVASCTVPALFVICRIDVASVSSARILSPKPSARLVRKSILPDNVPMVPERAVKAPVAGIVAPIGALLIVPPVIFTFAGL